MKFDLSLFPQIGKFLFDTGVAIYESLEFDFGGFTVNGWWLIIGIAITCIVIWLIGRILE